MNAESEAARLNSLRKYDILDSEPERAYDDLTMLAAEICGVPIAMVTIIDEKRQWTKASVGVDLVEVSRDLSFCNHTIQQRELLVVPDTRFDNRFAQNPFVTGNPNVRFYAGFPLMSREGMGLGSLCVVDTKPRELTERQSTLLAALGRQVGMQLELRRRLRELHETETERDRFFNASVDLLTIHKLGETSYRQVNASWERTLGYAPKEICNRDFLEFVHPDDVEPSKQVLGGLAHGQDVHQFTNRYRHKDGSWRSLEWQAFAPQAGEELVYGAARDVTAHVEAVEKLRLKTRELETVFDVFPDPFFQLNADGVIIAYRGGQRGKRGPFSDDCVGRRFSDLLPADVARRLKEAKAEARHSLTLQHLEFTLPSAEGERSYEVRILTHDPKVVIVVIRDITDRVVADRVQLAAKQAAESANKSKSEFLASMSHELRTPLNTILNISESLGEGVYGGMNEKQQHSLQTVAESGRHLLGLINDILDLSKIEAGKLDLNLGRVSVPAVCEASLRLVREQARHKNQDISLTIYSEVTEIRADERKLKQVLVNLLSNAIKFTAEKGRIGLEVATSGDSLAFAVWDTGIGISRENQGKLFQAFVQLDSKLSREYAGTGLGLSLAQRLAVLHQGRIEVESTAGVGSRFTAYFPIGAMDEKTERPKTAAASNGTAPKARADEARILLVEDTEANRECIGDYLVSKGFSLQLASNGTEALQRATEQVPDVILMDIQMSGMDGFEAMRQLRANPLLEKTPIIALTALAMEGDSARCLAAGATHYLSKPVALKDLVSTVLEVLDETHPAPGASAT